MSFYNKMSQTVDNVSVTENGMVGYKTTYHPLLDMNFKIGSYRNMTDKQIVEDFKKVLQSEDSTYVLRFMFMVRDAREGLGERRLFRVMLKELMNYDFKLKDEVMNDIIDTMIAEYGRYDDLFVFMGTRYESRLIETLRSQLSKDYDSMQAGTSCSLLAKWMPSENTSSKDSRSLARKVIKAFGTTPKHYRQFLSCLRSYLKVVETQTSANEWDKIDYNAVPSKANLKYKDAFLRHDEQRRREFLAKLAVGDKSVKINSSTNYPHEIVRKYMVSAGWYDTIGAYDEALEQLWKALPQMEGLNDTIVVRDGSGSMYCSVQQGSKVQAIDVATALTIYCAERLNAEFKNQFITFSSRPQMVDLTDKSSLHTKLHYLRNFNDCSNTNLEAVFDLILKTAVDHKMKQEDIPSQILIVSDMEFDGATTSRNNSNVINACVAKFAQAGYKLPKLVFWNVCSRSQTIPCKENENGVILVSGFSVNVLKMVINGELDPFKALLKELNSERYANIPLIEIVYNNVTRNALNGRTSKTKNITKPSWL